MMGEGSDGSRGREPQRLTLAPSLSPGMSRLRPLAVSGQTLKIPRAQREEGVTAVAWASGLLGWTHVGATLPGHGHPMERRSSKQEHLLLDGASLPPRGL